MLLHKDKEQRFIMLKKIFSKKQYSISLIILITFLLIISINKSIRILALKNPIAKHIIGERKNAIYRAKGIKLSFAAPESYEYLSRVIEEGTAPEKVRIGGFRAYYEKAADFYPHIAEVQAMLGYCNYYQGNKQEALDNYIKAVKLEPKYFWNNFNLAILYFQNKDQTKAIEYLTKAISSDIDYSMKVTLLSSVYRSLWSPMKDPKTRTIHGLKSGYEKVFYMMVLLLKSVGQEQAAIKSLKIAAASLGEKDYSLLKNVTIDVTAF